VKSKQYWGREKEKIIKKKMQQRSKGRNLRKKREKLLRKLWFKS